VTHKKLQDLRSQITQIDTDIFDLAKKRLEIAKEIGQTKNKLKMHLQDFLREKQCLEFANQRAQDLKISPSFAQNLMQILMQESLTFQEKDRILQNADSKNKKALIIGGGGKMGLWFANFLASQGFYIEIFDPCTNNLGFNNIYPKGFLSFDHDFIIIATPLSATCQILQDLAQYRPSGIVFDISSLKDPVLPGLNVLQKEGIKVASIHPMFGPSVELLSNRHIILIDLGFPQTNQEISQLFENTMAKLICMSIEEHDHNMAYLLGLSHVINILFFSVLSKSGSQAKNLMDLSSSTFDAQLRIACQVANENPHLYYEIQALNPYGKESLEKLMFMLHSIQKMVYTKNESGFVKLMQNGYDYLKNCQLK